MTDHNEHSGAADRRGRIVIDLSEYRDARDPMPITFHRLELNQILRVYGRMVGEGPAAALRDDPAVQRAYLGQH